MSIPVQCLDCSALVYKGNRCPTHKRKKEANRSTVRIAYRDPVYLSYIKAARCEFCGSTDDLTKDHKKPLVQGGTNHHSNLRTLCRSCNSARRLMQ